jgi:hypothetical protein
MADGPKTGNLARYGAALIDQGYKITPIVPGHKKPFHDEWQKQGSKHADLKGWLAGSLGNYGVGIKCGDVCGVDLDSMDPVLIQHMLEWLDFELGLGPVRVGLAPKTLVLYRTESPFRKKFSNDYRDGLGDKHRLEVLGLGQQFVAFHLHPDTRRPYEWTSAATPLNTRMIDLPVLSEGQAQSIAVEFNRKAEELGFTIKRKARVGLPAVSGGGDEDVFAADVEKTVISDDELHAKLMLVTDYDTYETWTNVGMALWHQYDGSGRGLELWHEWSELSDKYQPSALEEKWPTFDGRDKGRQPMTARYIIKLAQEAEAEIQKNLLVDFKAKLSTVPDLVSLVAVCNEIKKHDFAAPERTSLLGVVKAVFKRIENTNLSITDARNMIRYEKPAVDRVLPDWLDGWCYISGENLFYNTDTRVCMVKDAFNTTFSRHMLTRKDFLEGRAVPETMPGDAAINVFQIEVVDGRRYIPGEDPFFRMAGQRFVNMFSEAEFPAVPKKLNLVEIEAQRTVLDHAAHLITDQRDRELFMSFLAYVVQTMKRPNWAIFLQGVQGDGKTLFSELMAAAVGSANVGVVDPKALEKEYNSYAEGHLINFIEEVKLHGQNKFDVINSMKPLITNSVATIRRMRTDWYNIPNVTAYVFMSNFADGLPIVKGETRYLAIMSRFQDPDVLAAFNSENPDYFDKVFAAIHDHPGAMRKLLLDYELHPEFSPTKRAPANDTRDYVMEINETDEARAVKDAMEDAEGPDMNGTLLNSTKLMDGMFGLGSTPMHSRTLGSILMQMGYRSLGQIRLSPDERCRFWSKSPERFKTGGKTDPLKIKNWINPGI